MSNFIVCAQRRRARAAALAPGGGPARGLVAVFLRLAGGGALLVDDARGDFLFPPLVTPLFLEFPFDLLVFAFALWTGTGRHGVLLFEMK